MLVTAVMEMCNYCDQVHVCNSLIPYLLFNYESTLIISVSYILWNSSVIMTSRTMFWMQKGT